MNDKNQHSDDLAAAEAEVRSLKDLMREKNEALHARDEAIKQLRRDLKQERSQGLLNRTKIGPAYRKTKKVGKQVAKSAVATAWVGIALAGSLALFAKYRPGR